MSFVDTDFWEDPPWGNGEKKYRLGLKPIDLNKWLDRKPDQNLFNHKKELLKSNYSDVIATTNDSEDAQKKLGDILRISKTTYPDLIAELSLNIQDDLCLMESKNKQRHMFTKLLGCEDKDWQTPKRNS
jgi:hypothetical protein